MSTPRLSVVIPAYNEEERLGDTLDALQRYFQPFQWEVEVIVVDDGSTDGTRRLAESQREKFPQLRCLSYQPNRGKGHAVRRGALEAKGEFILFFDADFSTPIDQLEKVWPLLEEGADVVIGSRSLPGSEVRVPQPIYRESMGRVFNLFVRMMVLKGFIDTQCGFKIFRRECAQQVFSRQRLRGFSFDVEILFIAQKLGYTLRDTPVVWINSPASRVHPIWDSMTMLAELVLIRINQLRGLYTREETS